MKLLSKHHLLAFALGAAAFFPSMAEAQCPAVCDSRALATPFEWIRVVDMPGIFNVSGDNGGYADFSSSFSPTYTAGTTISYSFQPGYGDGPFTLTWKGWMDFNQDGDFDDPGEEVLTNFFQGIVSGSFSIPATALNGPTKFRVATRFGSDPPSCGDYPEGETEDYCVTIVGGVTPSCDASSPVTGLSSVEGPSSVMLSWNPVPLSVGCRISGGLLGSFSSTRRIIGTALSSTSIPLSVLTPGDYNWKVNCSCTSTAPFDITPDSAVDTFSVIGLPARLASASGEHLTVLQTGNPNQLVLHIGSTEAGQRQLLITDLLGRVVSQTSFAFAEGENRVDLHTGHLSTGTYLVVLEGSERLSELFVKH